MRSRAAAPLATLRRAGVAHDASLVGVARRAAYLRLRGGFRLAEASTLGLLDPHLDRQELAIYVSRAELRTAQDALNPLELESHTEEKAVFAQLCDAADLPTPTVYAVLRQGEAGWTSGGSSPSGSEEWKTALRRDLPGEFVVKPTRASFGLGLEIYSRSADELADSAGRPVAFGALVERLCTDSRYKAWIFQERLRNHAELRAVSGTDTLQTLRIVTLLAKDGSVEILSGCLKVVMGDAVVDNIRGGETGNAVCDLGLKDGRLGEAYVLRPDGFGMVTCAAHPRTGIVFSEVCVPYWAETLALVERASHAFADLRTLGWDVAITEGGPVIIEANMWWGGFNEWGTMPEIMAALRDAT